MNPSGPTYELRLAADGDAAAVLQLTRAAYHKYVAIIGREPLPMTVDYGPFIRDGTVWLLCLGEDLVGVLVLVAEADNMLIYNVAVHPDYQKRGLGRRLLALAEGQACAAGFRRLRLYTNERMEANVALYRWL